MQYPLFLPWGGAGMHERTQYLTLDILYIYVLKNEYDEITGFYSR